MTRAVKPTPTPWANIDGYIQTNCDRPIPVRPSHQEWVTMPGGRLADEARANAAFIVRVANAHDDLVAALKQCRDEIVSIHRDGDEYAENHSDGFRLANAALAKAEA